MIFLMFVQDNWFLFTISIFFVLLMAFFEAKIYIFDRSSENKKGHYIISFSTALVYLLLVLLSGDESYYAIILYPIRFIVVLISFIIIKKKREGLLRPIVSLVLVHIILNAAAFIINSIYLIIERSL